MSDVFIILIVVAGCAYVSYLGIKRVKQRREHIMQVDANNKIIKQSESSTDKK
ncbi:MAG: hypothetical protein KAQ68_10405 [Clostridiales bacterium]|nr:hypothetical protein [Clostridiales bacterium]